MYQFVNPSEQGQRDTEGTCVCARCRVVTQPAQTVTVGHFKGCHPIKYKCQGKLTVGIMPLHDIAHSHAVHSVEPTEHHVMGAAGTACIGPRLINL